MNTFLKYCLLTTATFILLMHSLVPHQHHTIVTAQPTLSGCVHTESSFLGFLSEAFHLDLGNDHLENFKPVQKVDFALGFPIAAVVLAFEPLMSELAKDTCEQLPAYILIAVQYFISHTPLRGPPSI